MYKQILLASCALFFVTGCGGNKKPKTLLATVIPVEANIAFEQEGDRVFFGYDKHDLNLEAKATLDRQAHWLKQNPTLKVLIEGHTDERGTRDYNLALGERRAHAVYDYLAAQGVDIARMETKSYGKDRPAVTEPHNEISWAQNRRAVTIIKK